MVDFDFGGVTIKGKARNFGVFCESIPINGKVFQVYLLEELCRLKKNYQDKFFACWISFLHVVYIYTAGHSILEKYH